METFATLGANQSPKSNNHRALNEASQTLIASAAGRLHAVGARLSDITERLSLNMDRIIGPRPVDGTANHPSDITSGDLANLFAAVERVERIAEILASEAGRASEI